MNSETGKWIILVGALLIACGLIVYFFHDKLQWLGRLPGDIRIEKENFRLYFPVVTMMIISVIVTLVVNIIKRFIH
ncbi:MAG: DUF2905 domain-containing protein [Ferruginibacter sp.]